MNSICKLTNPEEVVIKAVRSSLEFNQNHLIEKNYDKITILSSIIKDHDQMY